MRRPASDAEYREVSNSNTGSRPKKEADHDASYHHTALTLRLLFDLPLRQTEGLLNSLFAIMGIDLSAPDHTTLSRRARGSTFRFGEF